MGIDVFIQLIEEPDPLLHRLGSVLVKDLTDAQQLEHFLEPRGQSKQLEPAKFNVDLFYFR